MTSIFPKEIYNLIFRFQGVPEEWRETHPPLPYIEQIHSFKQIRDFKFELYHWVETDFPNMANRRIYVNKYGALGNSTVEVYSGQPNTVKVFNVIRRERPEVYKVHLGDEGIEFILQKDNHRESLSLNNA